MSMKHFWCTVSLQASSISLSSHKSQKVMLKISATEKGKLMQPLMKDFHCTVLTEKKVKNNLHPGYEQFLVTVKQIIGGTFT